MNWNSISTVYVKELRDMLRDRRTIKSMIIIPTIAMPLLIFGFGKIMFTVFFKAEQEVATIMISGGEDSPAVIAALKAEKKFRVVPLAEDWKQKISEKKVRAVVQIPPHFEADMQSGNHASSVIIYNYDGEMKSGFAAGQLERFFRIWSEKAVEQRLVARGLPATLVQPFETKRENVAPPEKVGGNTLGGIVPYLIVILCFTGAMYPAMDLTAGEKERGTMETLLCSPVDRVDIVFGKFLVVLTSSLSAMTLSLTSTAVSFALGGSFLGGSKAVAAAAAGKSAGHVMAMIDPFGIFGVLAMVLPVAVLFSAVLLTVSLFAKSFKEAQSYVGPMIFVVLLPAMIGMLPGIDLNARLALVPILNLSLICKEMLSGVWHWDLIAIIFGSTCVYAGLALAWCVRMFNREDVIFRA